MSDDEKTPEPPKWEHKKEFAINTKMREVVLATKAVTEAEIVRLRRQLEKLTYGS
jgi:hypothetical protein